MRFGRVLNAFRHQRTKHFYADVLTRAAFRCSTPFGINGRNTIKTAGTSSSCSMCSTPFGINGRNTGRHWRTRQLPCGAQRLSASTDETRATLWAMRQKRLSAQRLSASTDETLAIRLPGLASVECSTPFGINGRNTPATCESHPRTVVLNAFRHQRTKHGEPQPECGTKGCAQRLSASTDETPPFSEDHHRVIEVLNAFRHQRTKHVPVHGGEQRQRRVLNAFRHQRTKHPRPREREDLALEVLNAFRHQRTKHSASIAACTAFRRCSTPFGINGRNTVRIPSPCIVTGYRVGIQVPGGHG